MNDKQKNGEAKKKVQSVVGKQTKNFCLNS